MTLCQYYDRRARQLGYKDWNVMSADLKADGKSVDWYKKSMKQDYKQLKKEGKLEISNDT